jgi:hypothetical protein
MMPQGMRLCACASATPRPLPFDDEGGEKEDRGTLAASSSQSGDFPGDMRGLNLGQLQKIAHREHSALDLEAALDSGSAKAAILAPIDAARKARKHASDGEPRSMQLAVAGAEMFALKLGALHKRAAAEGVEPEAMEAALDAAFPREILIGRLDRRENVPRQRRKTPPPGRRAPTQHETRACASSPQ